MASVSPDSSPDDIVADIDATRERLADTIDALIDRTSPKNVARRTGESIKAKFVDEQGAPRLETILPVVGGIVAVVGLIVVIKRVAGD